MVHSAAYYIEAIPETAMRAWRFPAKSSKKPKKESKKVLTNDVGVWYYI